MMWCNRRYTNAQSGAEPPPEAIRHSTTSSASTQTEPSCFLANACSRQHRLELAILDAKAFSTITLGKKYSLFHDRTFFDVVRKTDDLAYLRRASTQEQYGDKLTELLEYADKYHL